MEAVLSVIYWMLLRILLQKVNSTTLFMKVRYDFMKKKLFSLFLVLVLVAALIPAAHAQYVRDIYLTEGSYAEEMLCQFPRQEYSCVGGPAGTFLQEDPGAGQLGLILYGTPSAAGTYYMSVNCEDGSSYEFTVHVASPAVPVGIGINSWPSRMSYTAGEYLNTDGLSLNVTYSDGSQSQCWGGFNCYPTYLDTPGNQQITVDYNGMQAYFTVEVQSRPAVITGIGIASAPSKTNYKVGEYLNTNGLSINVYYSDGSVRTEWNGFSCSPGYFNRAGSQDVNVSYSGFNTSFRVNVTENITLTGISVAQMPGKTVYNVGETLDTNGLMINLNYSDGSRRTVVNGFTCAPAKLDNSGKQKITVTYENKNCTFDVTVNKVIQPTPTPKPSSSPAPSAKPSSSPKPGVSPAPSAVPEASPQVSPEPVPQEGKSGNGILIAIISVLGVAILALLACLLKVKKTNPEALKGTKKEIVEREHSWVKKNKNK